MSSLHLLQATPMYSLTDNRTRSMQQFATTVSCRPQRLWGSFSSMPQRQRQLSTGKHQTQKQSNQVQSIRHLQAKSSALVFQRLLSLDYGMFPCSCGSTVQQDLNPLRIQNLMSFSVTTFLKWLGLPIELRPPVTQQHSTTSSKTRVRQPIVSTSV